MRTHAGATTWGTNQLTVDRRLLEAAGRARPAAQPADARVLVRMAPTYPAPQRVTLLGFAFRQLLHLVG